MSRHAIGVVVAVLAATALVAHANSGALVVHEWGTFLTMSGSDGVALDGMYHEEHALPAFVHARSTNQLKLPFSNAKSETPVIYFYTDTPRDVRVEVGFPGGFWTQWYPQATLVAPNLPRFGSLLRVRNGSISWSVSVWPPDAVPEPKLPPASPDALWNFARDVDAAYVITADPTRPGGPREWERFIFYRGLGEIRLPIDLSATGGVRLSCDASLPYGVSHVFVLRVEQGRGAYRYAPSLDCGGGGQLLPPLGDARPLDEFAETIGRDLEARLVQSGLYPKEARAMVNTWRGSYFTTEGIRALFVLPEAWTNENIPLRLTPQPDEIVRVMVGRMELLTPERERRAEAAVRDLAAPDADIRARAFGVLREEGRYVEPIVRRTLKTTTDERVRELCRRLLLTDFVTEIRTSLTSATTGARVAEEPVYLRAQLASVLREIGLEEEARQEGRAALAALQDMKQPTMTDHGSRHTYRAFARAHEGAGNDRDALRYYGEFVEFGSTFAKCSQCHQEGRGPRDASFFPDWWAGRKYGEYAQKTGLALELIAQQEAALRRNDRDFGATIKLAYLHEAGGNDAQARRIWERVSR
jgi:hypothetical protein